MSAAVVQKCLDDPRQEDYFTNAQSWAAPTFSESVGWFPGMTVNSSVGQLLVPCEFGFGGDFDLCRRHKQLANRRVHRHAWKPADRLREGGRSPALSIGEIILLTWIVQALLDDGG